MRPRRYSLRWRMAGVEVIVYLLWFSAGGVIVQAVPATVDCTTLAVAMASDVASEPSAAWIIVRRGRARWHVSVRRHGDVWRLVPADRREIRHLRSICPGRR